METLTDYTHKGVHLEDIRLKRGRKKGDDFFAIKVENLEEVVFVNYNIFNDRIKAFFLGKSVNEIERYQVLDLPWNFVITQGYYLKIIDKDLFEKVEGTPNKKYVSVLEVAGPIGRFENNFSNVVKVREMAPNVY